MNCQDARTQLGLLARDGLGLTELAALGTHVRQCAGCGRELDRLRQGSGARVGLVPWPGPRISVTALLGPAGRAVSGAMAVTRRRIGGLSGALARTPARVDIVCRAWARSAVAGTKIVGTGAFRVRARAAAPLAWTRRRPVLASTVGFALTSTLAFHALGPLTLPTFPAAGPLEAPRTRPEVAPLEAAALGAPPALLEAPGPGEVAGAVPAAPPRAGRPEAVTRGAAAVPERTPGPAPARARTVEVLGAPASRPATGRPTPVAPVRVEPEPADAAPRMPDVIGRLAVKDLGAAERDLAALLERLGATEIARRRGPGATVLEAVVPRTGYAELGRGLTAIGAWLVEAQRSSLPDGIRITIRLSPGGPSRSRDASVRQLG